jgi:hypothetical protein
MRAQSDERTVMVMLFGGDFPMTDAAAKAMYQNAVLLGAAREYRAISFFVAEADEGVNPDIELYFAVPEEGLDALGFSLGGEPVKLSDAPHTIADSVDALINAFAPSDLTLGALGGDAPVQLNFDGQPLKPHPLDVLMSEHDAAYAQALAFLSNGSVFADGVKDEAAKGLQRLIVQLGGDVVIDGKIGKKTIAAMQAVTYGYLGTPGAPRLAIDAEAFESMLASLLVQTDAERAKRALSDTEIIYYQAAASLRAGDYYAAYAGYSKAKGYLMSDEFLPACAQPWPEDGELSRSDDLIGGTCALIVQTTLSDGMAACVKLQTEAGEPALTLFVKARGEARAQIPAGAYIALVGVGKTWFGERDGFGAEDAHYLRVKFDGAQTLHAEGDHSYTLTLDGMEDAEGVGARTIPYNSFVR